MPQKDKPIPSDSDSSNKENIVPQKQKPASGDSDSKDPKSSLKDKAEELKKTGNEFFNNGYFVKAVELYSEAIKLDSTNHVYFSNRAQAYRMMKLYQEAKADYSRAIEIEPNDVLNHYRKAKTLAVLHETQEAKEALAKAKELD